jgi:signal peptidase
MSHQVADQECVETSGRLTVVVFTLKVLLSAVVMSATTTMFSLFSWTILPFAVGWSPSVVVTGSMEPSIEPGDIVVTAPIDPSLLKAGHVIRFKDPSHTHPYLLHRIYEISDDGTFVTKGDANQSKDSTPVPLDNVTGVARLRVPVIGLPAVWLRNGQYLQLGLTLLAVAIAARVLTGLRALVTSGQDLSVSGGKDPADADQPVEDSPAAEQLPGAPLVGALQAGPVAAPGAAAAATTGAAATAPAGAASVATTAAATWQETDSERATEVVAQPARSGGRHRAEGRATWRQGPTVARPRGRRRASRGDRSRASTE